jgi:sulfite reductase (NADPH) flavoprotein alpha-component
MESKKLPNIMKHPLFVAKIKQRWEETKTGSTKKTFHLTLDTAGSDLTYKVGDSVAIYAPNDPLLVQRILQALRIDPLHHPHVNKILELKANLSKVTSALLKQFDAPSTPGMDLLDLAENYGDRPFNLEAFLAALPPLLPRFYSIASSQREHPGEIHLLVALTSFQHGEEVRYGVASHFLCHRAEIEATPISCYIQPTPHFTLPSDHNTPIIMVGPGTGVAPFRAFVQERLHHQAPGKNWLFFGERHRGTDFFYEEFWTSLAEEKRLFLDLAFSRDGEEKVYVQHRIMERGADIWSWLEEGARFYVCGDADPMAKDVEAALHQTCMTHGNLSSDEARGYIRELRRAKRYLADVY